MAFSQTVILPPAYFTFGLIDTNGNSSLLNNGSTIYFPPTLLGATASVTVSITNGAGDAAGAVTGVQVTGPAFQLSGTPPPGTSISGGSTISFTLRFTPTQLAQVGGTLTIQAGGSAVTFAITGSGLGAIYSYQLQQGSTVGPVLPSQTIAFPNTPTGSSNVATIQVTNNGNTTGQIAAIAVMGTAFQLADLPFLPATLAPQASFTFQVVFAPTVPGPVTGALEIGSDTFNLSGNALGSLLTFSYTTAGTTIAVPSTGGTVVFSPTAVGASSSTMFIISNQGTSAGVIASIGISGAAGAFTIPNLPPLPLNLAAGASVSFAVNFNPSAAGVATASLMINALSFVLSGAGTSPAPLPSYSFTGASGTQNALAQPAVGLTLASPYSVDLTGTLTLTFTSAEFTDDPAIQFATGSRTVNFTIPADTTQAVFSNGATQVLFATGSVAGTITLTPSFMTTGGVNLTPASPLSLNLTIAPAPPAIVSAEIDSPSGTGFTVTFTGVATGRNLSQVTLNFTPASGVPVAIPNVSLNVQSQFSTWYGSSASDAYGSLFTASVPITLSGQLSGFPSLINAVQSLTLTLANAQGSSAPVTLMVQ